MQPETIPDIYLMKRQKSRAGCMTVLIVTLVVLVLAGIFAILSWKHAPESDAPEVLETTEQPAPADLPADEPAPPAPPAMPAPQPRPASPAAAETAPAAAAPIAASAPTPSAVAPAADGDADPLLARARELRTAGDYQGARESALAALAIRPNDPGIEAVLNEIAMPLLASTRPMPEKTQYVVQRGDFLGRIAATYNTPVDLIARANNIPGALIRTGQTLTLFDGRNHEFAALISKSRNDLVLTIDGQFFKRYRVATGRDNKTPTGSYPITDKIEHPPWHKPGAPPIPYGHPDNELGTHWLAIDLPGYGLHGTWEPDTIGRQASDGCIRMTNDDIKELYTILPRGTVVTITD